MCSVQCLYVDISYRYAVVLAFDVKIERDAQEHADKEGIKIFSAEIIYHLFDKFTAYCEVSNFSCIFLSPYQIPALC